MHHGGRFSCLRNQLSFSNILIGFEYDIIDNISEHIHFFHICVYETIQQYCVVNPHYAYTTIQLIDFPDLIDFSHRKSIVLTDSRPNFIILGLISLNASLLRGWWQ